MRRARVSTSRRGTPQCLETVVDRFEAGMRARLAPSRPVPPDEIRGAPAPLLERRLGFDHAGNGALPPDQHTEVELAGYGRSELSDRVPVVEQRPARGIGDVQQVPGKPELEQSGGLVDIPVREARVRLGSERQETTVVAPGGEEGAVPAEARTIGDHEE